MAAGGEAAAAAAGGSAAAVVALRREERDACELLQRMCSLSIKKDSLDPSWVRAGPGLEEAMGLQSKILSLELLLAMLRQAGSRFRTDPSVVAAIRQHLCLSLLRNGVSTAPLVLNASLKVFVALMAKFRSVLKDEIEVLFTTVFLRILESPHSTMQQKGMLLQLLQRVCSDPHALVDMYVNYDCDMLRKDIFAKMVNQLTRVVQTGAHAAGPPGLGPSGPLSDPESLMLRTRGLEAVVALLDSLIEWTRRLTLPSLSLPPSNPPRPKP